MIETTGAARAKYVDLARIRSMIDEGPYDAVIAMSPENVTYLSGFYNFDIRTIPERLHLVVWPKGADPAFVVTERRQRSFHPGDTFISDVVGYQGEGLDSMRAVADVLTERGLTTATVGIEGRQLPFGHGRELQRLLPKLKLEDAYLFLESIRAVKTPAEVETLKRVGGWTTEAIDTAFRAARPGDTERDIMTRMESELLKRGADLIMAPIIGAGERSGYWHGLATDQPVENGMLIKVDFGGMLDGYYSDVARTACMGRASDYQRDLHAKSTEVKYRMIDAIKPGMLASELARIGRQAYADLGLEFKFNILGHGIGLGIHEPPQIYTWADDPILPGMTMMIETGYTDYPRDSIHVEDLILITEAGAEYLTDPHAHDKLWELGL